MAAIAAAISIVTLAGYALGAARLVVVSPGQQPMAVGTALLCLILAGGIVADVFERIGPTRAAGAGGVALAGGILIGRAWTGVDVISPALLSVFGTFPGESQTSTAAALCTGFLAIGCLSRPRAQPAAILAVAAMAIGGTALLGYAYGVEDLYALSPFRTMSLRTTFAITSLGLGFLLSNWQSGIAALILADGTTGTTTRRQLGFLVVPPVVAWLLLKATAAHGIGLAAAMAFLVVLTVGPLAALILRDAKALTRLDAERRDKRRADKAKLEAERRYGTLFNRLQSGFCVIEMAFDAAGRPSDYRFLEVNPAFTRQTGLTDAEGRWMREIAPDHEQHWFDVYGQVALTGEPARFEHEAVALRRFYDVTAFRVHDPELRRVAILFDDVSDRRRAELDLKALNETLERRVGERAAELELTQEALRQAQKLEAIGQLTGGVAHDFNNLLTVIRGSVDLLRRPNLTEERRAKFINAIGETAERATKLTNQLLAFARRQSLRPETFNIGDSLSESMTIISALTGAGVALDLNLPQLACFVHADRSQFDTSIVNMAINARDAMDGQGRLVISSGPVSGIPALRSHPPVVGDFIAVTIADTGGGIAPEDLSRIFEPFYTTKSVGAGTGLGLSQVIGFAKQTGGDIRVESTVGAGTTFTLYLPREYEAPEDRPVFDLEGAVGGQGVRVLVVEDNAQVGEFAIQSLNELGYESALAADAVQALDLLAVDRSRFDIVFSDVVMPGKSGLELGEDIRRLYPDLPVVLTSGYSHVLAQNGAHGFELLHKPYSIEQLSRVLRKVLAWSGTLREAAGQVLGA